MDVNTRLVGKRIEQCIRYGNPHPSHHQSRQCKFQFHELAIYASHVEIFMHNYRFQYLGSKDIAGYGDGVSFWSFSGVDYYHCAAFGYGAEEFCEGCFLGGCE